MIEEVPADLWELDKSSAELFLISSVQFEAGLLHLPRLPQVVLVVTVHKDGVTPGMGIQDLVRNLQNERASH